MRYYDRIEGKISTSPYSKDLRKKVINYLSKGKTQKAASEIFAVHRNTISLWWIRYNKEGNYAAKARLGLKGTVDYSEVELFVRNNLDTKLVSIGNKFGISAWHAGRILRKLNFIVTHFKLGALLLVAYLLDIGFYSLRLAPNSN